MAHLVDAADASLRAAHVAAEDHAHRVAELVAAGEPAVDLSSLTRQAV